MKDAKVSCISAQHNQAASQSFTEPAQSNQGYAAEGSFQYERERESSLE